VPGWSPQEGWCTLRSLRGAARSGRLAIVALLGLESLAFTQSRTPAIDRLLEPQKLVVEIFRETGISKADVVQALENGPVSLSSIYAPGGIAVELAYRDDAIAKDPDYLEVQKLQTPSTESTWYVGILLAGESTRHGQGILSLMPDSEGRRTAFVYMNASLETKNPAWATFNSVAHELTHLLNLHHSDWEGTSFTQDSTIEGYAQVDSVRWRLSESSVKHLRYAPDAFVRPGGVEFGVVLAEHSSRHQSTPNEVFDVVASLEEVGRRPLAAARTPPPPPRPRSVGPTIVIGSELTDQQTTTREKVSVFLVVQAMEDSLADIRVSLAGAAPGAERELRHLTNPNPDRQNLDLSVQLAPGTNRVIVFARDQSGHTTEESLTLVREDVPGKLLAVVFGVKEYTNVRPLKHSISDARSVRDLLLNLGLEKERLFYEEDPSLTKVRTGLGNWLRQQAGPKDVVFVYFAGHGAAEIDPLADDRDQLSKYLCRWRATSPTSTPPHCRCLRSPTSCARSEHGRSSSSSIRASAERREAARSPRRATAPPASSTRTFSRREPGKDA
jgi:hypothetical protein